MWQNMRKETIHLGGGKIDFTVQAIKVLQALSIAHKPDFSKDHIF